MKKKTIAFLAILLLSLISACGNPAAGTSSPDLQQSLDEFKDSWNALKEGIQTVGDDVASIIDETTTALEDTKNSIEEVTGVGSVSALLDGGKRFAYDCAASWYPSRVALDIDVGEYKDATVALRDSRVEISTLGDCSRYSVKFPIVAYQEHMGPTDDNVTIMIYTANDGSGGYYISSASDSARLFPFGDDGEYGVYTPD